MYHKDYETYSACDIGFGATRYARDPSTEILMLALARDNEEPLLWLPHQWRSVFPGHDWAPAEALLKEYVESSEPVYAHNSGFEIAVSQALFKQTFGYPAPDLSRYRCTAAMARRAALPHSLKKCAEALNLPQQKDNRGSALIRKFSCPQKDGSRILPTDEPEAFREFCQYCLQDVVVEQAIHRALHLFELKGFPLATYQLDIMINQRGIPVNIPAARHAQSLIEQATDKLTKEFFELTGLQPTQGVRFLEWLKERGYTGDDLRKRTVDDILNDEEFTITGNDEVARALRIKQSLSFASLKKIKFMIEAAWEGRIYDCLMWYGAIRTGRFSGQGLQIQNFKRPPETVDTDGIYLDIILRACLEWMESEYGNVLQSIAQSIRHFVHNLKRTMLNADLSAIEARVGAWLVGEQWRLEVFATHGRIYEASACQMFKMKMEEFDTYRRENGKHHPARQKGKVAELALFYQGGENALIAMGALDMGLEQEELKPIVDAWREANQRVTAGWRETEQAAKKAILNPGLSVSACRCTFFTARTAGINYLFLRLPSGRCLAYPHVKLEPCLRFKQAGKWKSIANPTEDDIARYTDDDGKAPWVTDNITYWGPVTGKAVWARNSLSGGKIIENMCQSISADIMMHGAVLAERRGYQVLTTVHDELITENLPGNTIEGLIECMTDVPPWAPGLPLKAEGAEIPYYSK